MPSIYGEKIKVLFTRACNSIPVGFQLLGVVHILLFEEDISQSRSAFKLLGKVEFGGYKLDNSQ